jgi:hypothetical protein
MPLRNFTAESLLCMAPLEGVRECATPLAAETVSRGCMQTDMHADCIAPMVTKQVHAGGLEERT